jgi:glycosyltransferase involved in cell wall biosynthesis
MGNKKYTIRLLYDVQFWAYYWRCLALQKYAPPDFDVSIGSNYGAALKEKKHDLILQLAYSYAKDVRKHLNVLKYNTLLVSSYNVGWGYANNWLPPVIKESDYVIINNREMWEKSGKNPKTFPISNGVDLDKFNVKKPIELRKPRVLWVGSITHRKTKNYDSILVPLSKMLQNEKIAWDFKLVDSCGKNRMNQEQMCCWYNTGTIYVVASSQEGTPNPAIESAACGCTVVSTRCGNMPELIEHGKNGFLCDTSVSSLMAGIRSAVANNKQYCDNMQETIKSWGWKERSKQYYDFFRKIIDERRK